EAVDVVFAVDHEAGGAPVGFDLPLGGHDGTRNVHDAADHWNKFAPGEMLLKESANGTGEIVQPIDPQDFMPFCIADGNAVARVRPRLLPAASPSPPERHRQRLVSCTS